MSTAPTPVYVYRAAAQYVTDGDTVHLLIDVGCDTCVMRTIRLIGVNAPELHGPTAERGHAARQFADDWLIAAWKDHPLPRGAAMSWPLVVATTLDKTEKYGRLLGRVYRTSDGRCLNDDLIANGHAVAWDGKGARP